MVRMLKLCAICLLVPGLALACSKKTESEGNLEKTGAAKKEEPAAAAKAPANPKVGDSCKDLSAADGLISCDGNKMIFCSSFSDYKWKLQQECGDGTKCVRGADGKTASCK